MRHFGNPDRKDTLLAAIMDIFREHDEYMEFTAKDITHKLLQGKHWGEKVHDTPQQSVTSYLSQNTDIFEWVGDNTYKMYPAYFTTKQDG